MFSILMQVMVGLVFLCYSGIDFANHEWGWGTFSGLLSIALITHGGYSAGLGENYITTLFKKGH